MTSVLKYAKRDLKAIFEQPRGGIDISHPKTGHFALEAWTDAEIRTLFSQTLHTTYELPRAIRKAGRRLLDSASGHIHGCPRGIRRALHRDLILGHEQAGEGATYGPHSNAELLVIFEKHYTGLD